MDRQFFLEKFQNSAAGLDKKLLIEKQIDVATGLYKDSVVLKLYKKSWANQVQDPLTSESRIFFSVWINDAILQDQKLFYNIHALKLRQLKGYQIESRKFADRFREGFKKFEHQWQNVGLNYGPLTLMQGCIKIDPEKIQDEITVLSNNFLAIEYLIDNTLTDFKRT